MSYVLVTTQAASVKSDACNTPDYTFRIVAVSRVKCRRVVEGVLLPFCVDTAAAVAVLGDKPEARKRY